LALYRGEIIAFSIVDGKKPGKNPGAGQAPTDLLSREIKKRGHLPIHHPNSTDNLQPPEKESGFFRSLFLSPSTISQDPFDS